MCSTALWVLGEYSSSVEEIMGAVEVIKGGLGAPPFLAAEGEAGEGGGEGGQVGGREGGRMRIRVGMDSMDVRTQRRGGGAPGLGMWGCWCGGGHSGWAEQGAASAGWWGVLWPGASGCGCVGRGAATASTANTNTRLPPTLEPHPCPRAPPPPAHAGEEGEGDSTAAAGAAAPAAAPVPVVRRPAVLADGTYATQSAVEASPVLAAAVLPSSTPCMRALLMVGGGVGAPAQVCVWGGGWGWSAWRHNR